MTTNFVNVFKSNANNTPIVVEHYDFIVKHLHELTVCISSKNALVCLTRIMLKMYVERSFYVRVKDTLELQKYPGVHLWWENLLSSVGREFVDCRVNFFNILNVVLCVVLDLPYTDNEKLLKKAFNNLKREARKPVPGLPVSNELLNSFVTVERIEELKNIFDLVMVPLLKRHTLAEHREFVFKPIAERLPVNEQAILKQAIAIYDSLPAKCQGGERYRTDIQILADYNEADQLFYFVPTDTQVKTTRLSLLTSRIFNVKDNVHVSTFDFKNPVIGDDSPRYHCAVTIDGEKARYMLVPTIIKK